MNFFKKNFIFFLAYSCISINLCLAQDVLPKQSQAYTELEEITITGSPSKQGDAVLSLPIIHVSQQNTSNLGNLLSGELGVSSTSFGNNASRPVLRGMSGNRVPILQNGMGSGDLSSLSDDHAVSSDPVFLQKIQVLRGSEALRFGAGSSSGLITLENNRISEEQPSSPYTEFQSQYNFQNQGFLAGVLTEGSVGSWSLHFDGVKKSSNDYVRPDGMNQNYSSQQLLDLGFGATFHRDHSSTGISYGEYRNNYGIPSVEGSFIDLFQKRLDLVHVIRNPIEGFSKLDLKYAYTNYQHTEFSAVNIPQTYFTNVVNQVRFEAFHDVYASWLGSVGLQLRTGKLGAIDLTSVGNSAAVIPTTQSNSLAIFLVENTSLATIDFKTGIRFEKINQSPDSNAAYSDNPLFSNLTGYKSPARKDVQENLLSASVSAFWNYVEGYKTGLTLQMIQRAPSVDELYAYGNHDATASFDIGNSSLSKESTYQFEWAWRKTQGFWQGQINLFQNKTRNYIYGLYTNETDLNSNYPVRQFTQGNATLTGFEAELLLNSQGPGFSARLFSDGSRGSFDDASNLPLQPTLRLGGHVGYDQGLWSSKLSLIHGLGQTRLATFETYPTPSYNKLDFRVSRKMNFGTTDGNLYLMANNLLNDTIRYSTTVESIRFNAPQAGRSVVLGLSVFY
jgi:iron complex outermembrane receptor protein